jgi:hypothetical protein
VSAVSAGRALATAPVLAVALAGCGSFDSAKSGESLIRSYVTKYEHGATLRSVSCPSGVSEKTGGTFTCSLVLRFKRRRSDTAGTFTIHMIAGNKVAIDSRRDLHLR